MSSQNQGFRPLTRAERFMSGLRWLIVAVVAGLALWAWWPRLRHPSENPHLHASVQRYVCPMHPQIAAGQPGQCPICQMDLVPLERDTRPEVFHAGAGAPAGTQPLQLTRERAQAIGMHTAVALSQQVSPTLQVTGLVQAPEPGRSEVHVRAPSFIEKVLVTETGVTVHKGDALALIFSPEIIALEGEVLAAGQWADRNARTAVRQRLSLYGLDDAEADALFREGRPRRLLTLRAPQDGVVMACAAVPGGYAMPETALYELQDLSTLWMEVAVPPAVLPKLQPGSRAVARMEGQPQPVLAVFDRVLPRLDAELRTARVRFVVADPPKTLLPGAWLQVALPLSPPHQAILVPRDAVLDAGQGQYVFRAAPDGWFLPTSVEVGALYGENREILAGLSAGDSVVATAAFLVDAESRVKASLRGPAEAVTATVGGQP